MMVLPPPVVRPSEGSRTLGTYMLHVFFYSESIVTYTEHRVSHPSADGATHSPAVQESLLVKKVPREWGMHKSEWSVGERCAASLCFEDSPLFAVTAVCWRYHWCAPSCELSVVAIESVGHIARIIASGGLASGVPIRLRTFTRGTSSRTRYCSTHLT